MRISVPPRMYSLWLRTMKAGHRTGCGCGVPHLIAVGTGYEAARALAESMVRVPTIIPGVHLRRWDR